MLQDFFIWKQNIIASKEIRGISMNKIVLTQEKETLLIPLYGKAKENEKPTPILRDDKAAEIIGHIEYNFNLLKIPEKTNIMMCIRAKILDELTAQYLAAQGGGIALHLGCGLDSRYVRIGDKSVDWYDVDFPEVIELRRNFYSETQRYHTIPSSVTDAQWLQSVPDTKAPCIVVAEGLLMYLTEDEIIQMIGRIVERVGSFRFVFDAFSTLTAKSAAKHPSLKKTGAGIHWGVDKPETLESWGLGMRFLQERTFTAKEELQDLGAGTRMLFQAAGHFKAARNAHRILVFQVG